MKKSIDSMVEEYRKIRQDRLDLDKQAKALGEAERVLKDLILEELDRLQLKSAGGEDFTVYKQQKTLVRVSDWEKFYNHIQQTGHFDLLQKRPAVLALADRAVDGDAVPGVELGHYFDVSVRTKGAK
ncbi:MAG: hypothetical protein GTN78_03275 [Gemmatimonadales bacterium]|nr:hypothetical protein [Gemmatimonadales bacterium]